MGCSNCSVSSNGVPSGCGDKGHCTSGSCNKLNTYDWLTKMEIHDPLAFNHVEVSFKKGAQKEFYANPKPDSIITGDMVVVETGNGYDVGRINLSGELVRLQMKKKKVAEDRMFNPIIRKANQRDLEKLQEARDLEKPALIKSRAIARTLDLEMKIGDVQFQGDKRKATFYYTAEGRVDLRELVRLYAKEFKVKIEMRQIGSRQESARVGGIGSCGRELCCSTWLTDFKSVSTSAARYQYMAINQSKLSGQCGRLKCCLNYELDTYLDALEGFPKNANHLKTAHSKASLMKVDIFKGLMYYGIELDGRRGPVIALDKEQVKKVLALNKKGEYPEDLMSLQFVKDAPEEENFDFGDVTGVIELPPVKKKRRNKSKRSNQNRNRSNSKQSNRSRSGGDKRNTKGPAKKSSNPRSKNQSKPSGDKPSSKSGKSKPNNNSDKKKP